MSVPIPFPHPTRPARLVRRYKRFLADVEFPDGARHTIHCPGTGAMTGLLGEGRPILVSDRGRKNRKLRYTWELSRSGRVWVAVDPLAANRLVGPWLQDDRIGLGVRGPVRREVRTTLGRLDFAVGEDTVVEVKSVTLREGRAGLFPDAPTERGRRHLRALIEERRAGRRAVLLFFAARGDVREVAPADEVDPSYGEALREAAGSGVEVRAIRARFTRRGAALEGSIPVRL